MAERYRLLYRLDADEPRFKAADQRLARDVTVCFANLDVDSADLIRGTTQRRPVSGLHHPALEPLFDVGYDVEVASSYLVTSYLPSVALAGRPPSPELGRLVLAELASLLLLLREEGLGYAGFTARHIRLVVEDAEGSKLRVPFTGLYLNDQHEHSARDVSAMARLVLQTWGPSATSADQRLRPRLVALAEDAGGKARTVEQRWALLLSLLTEANPS